MTLLFIIAAVIIGLFGVVLLFGAPYLPTLNKQTSEALDLLNLKPGQVLLELGCGDGRVLRAAARRGIKAYGYELNPILVLVARAATWSNRGLVTVYWADYWRGDWPKADGIYTFLLDRYMGRLDKKIKAYPHKPINLVSFAFRVPGKRPDKIRRGLFLYIYK